MSRSAVYNSEIIIRAYHETQSSRQVAQIIGCSHQTVLNHLHAHFHAVRPQGQPAKAKIPKEPKPVRTEKRCPKCGETKPLSLWYQTRHRHTRLSTYCRACEKALSVQRTRKYRAAQKASREASK